MSAIDRCLVLKRYEKPKGADAYALGYFIRRTKDEKPVWKAWELYFPAPKPGDPEEITGVEVYKGLPTDAEIETFLKKLSWKSLSEPGVVMKRPGRPLKAGEATQPTTEKFTPTLTDGGICRTAWRKAFDRDPLSKLFPEFDVPFQKK
jgi:hypothetical protein